MNIDIGVPWRGGDVVREASWRYVRTHLTRVAAAVTTADADFSQPFSRAASRNAAVDHAKRALADVVILHDADMLAPRGAYAEMASLAHETRRLVVGYTQYRALSEQSTRGVLRGEKDPWAEAPLGTTEGWSVGGIIAIAPDAWDEIGGMDERFKGWGCEDFAFAHAASIVLGPNLRIGTSAIHLWHPHANGSDPEAETANAALMEQYLNCETAEQLRAVQR